MKKTKILALILAAIFIALPLLSCDGNGTGEDTSTDTSEETGANVTITVSMKVKNADGDVVYDIPSYVYNGEEPTIIDLIDYYFYMEMDPLYVDIDDEGGIRTIVSIGEIESGEVMEQVPARRLRRFFTQHCGGTTSTAGKALHCLIITL